MDPRKVSAILDWLVSSIGSELISFLGLASSYRRHIKSFAFNTALILDLMKGYESKFTKLTTDANERSEPKKKSFKHVMQCLVSRKVLLLPDFTLPFQAEID